MGDENDRTLPSRDDITGLTNDELRHRARLFDSILDAVVSTDASWIVRSWNRAAEEMYGWTAEEAIGRPIAEVVPTVYSVATADEVRHKLTEGPGAWVGEAVNRRKDGTTFHADCRASVIRDQDEKILGIVAIMRDITRLRAAEDRASRHSATLQGINRLMREGLACETSADVGKVCLSVAEELTGSQFGFIAEINDEGLFNTIAISDPGWEACRVPEGSLALAVDMPIRGIRGRVVQERTSMIFNDPSSHDDWVALPVGHPPLNSFLGVPLWVGDELFGEIGLANRESGYGPDDIRAVEALSAAFVEVLSRKRAEERVRDSLAEKEVLLREVHHRVKNNLQVITSLLNMQSRQVKDETVMELFRESQNRVRSMALTHEQLYRSSDLANVDLGRYVKDLASGLFRSYGVDPRRVRLTVATIREPLPLDLAIPCGLIITELVSNALKHAFPDGREGEIRIELTTDDTGLTTLRVVDNGVGLPEYVVGTSNKTLGLRLVISLATQLGGTIDVSGDDGTMFCVEFEIPGNGDGGTKA